ncbi:hypothetical protein Ddye_014223 [Dipteronia dyeriana]|uniref:Uncharacterized protein n=1 Tax=Dipteronia dyeriana TaxID=168575 RepID=A0AAD9X7T0_9ROSI|nr:hypothetical protein Ddye_014223 [Dipteronia dyeriana]
MKNQFETTKTHSRFSPPSGFHDHHDSITKTESHSTKIHLQPQIMALTNSKTKRQPKTLAIENRGFCDSQFPAAASSEVNNNKQITSLLFDFTENISSCSSPNDNLKIQMGQTHENLVGTNSNSKPRPTLHRNRPTTLVDMMQFVTEWFDLEENENAFCDTSGDRVVECGNSIQEKPMDCFDVIKNVEENDKIEFSISENFIQPMTEAFDRGIVKEVLIEPINQVIEGINTIKVQLEEPTIKNSVFEDFVLMFGVFIGQFVSTLCMGI